MSIFISTHRAHLYRRLGENCVRQINFLSFPLVSNFNTRKGTLLPHYSLVFHYSIKARLYILFGFYFYLNIVLKEYEEEKVFEIMITFNLTPLFSAIFPTVFPKKKKLISNSYVIPNDGYHHHHHHRLFEPRVTKTLLNRYFTPLSIVVFISSSQPR